MLTQPKTSVLGPDLERAQRINANSFQQNALTTVNGCQYAAYYVPTSNPPTGNSAFVALARRRVNQQHASDWETLVFRDYEQTVDDGHNTISIGVCKGDGTLHVSFDHHCNPLRFRVSKGGFIGGLEKSPWDASLFTPTEDLLPGFTSRELFKNVTYPRFVNVDDDMLFSYRIGVSGLGSDALFRYSSQTHTYAYMGTYLTGIANNPYINGQDYRLGRLHVSWCYRAEIPSGKNGPENNSGLHYAYSDDRGATWRSSDEKTIAILGAESRGTILPTTEGITIFPIPRDSGILNNEGQAPDWAGGFHVLNREIAGGEETWMHYYRNSRGKWRRTAVPAPSRPTDIGSRGSVCADRNNNIYFVLPGNTDSSLTILCSRSRDDYQTFETIWTGENFDGEPLVDVGRLESSDVLSIFTRTDARPAGNVVVLDFDVAGV